jgi:hypothetical protein
MRLRNNFYKWKSQARAKQRAENITQRCAWLVSVRAKNTLTDVFHEFRLFVRKMHTAKRFLKMAITGVERNAKADGFARWRAANQTHVETLHQEEITELKSRQVDQQAEIKRITRQIEIDNQGKARIVAQMKSLSQKVMANFVTRMQNVRISAGFYTWLEAVRQFNKRRRYLMAVMNHNKRFTVEDYFKIWAQNSYKIRQAELTRELAEKEAEKRRLIAEQKRSNLDQAGDITDLCDKLDEATKKREQLDGRFERAFHTWTERQKRNVYIPKKENIFGNWKRFVKMEKNAVNVIGAIVRKRLRAEVFERIRLVGRERHLDKRAEITCRRMFATIKHGA